MTKKIITIVSVILFSTIAYASQADSGSYKTISICSPDEGSVAVALDIREMVYTDKSDYKAILSTVVEDGKKGAPSAEALVAIFLNARLNKDVAGMKNLIHGEIPDPSQKALDRGSKMVEKWEQIKLNKKWSYGDYHTVIMDQIAPDGHTEKSSLDTIMIDGRYYLAMDFPQEMRMLYGYMMSDKAKGLIESTDYSELKYELKFTQLNSSEQGQSNELTVRVNASFNNFTEDWSEPNNNSENQASDFFCEARKITRSGSDEDFISLWSGNEHLVMSSKDGEKPRIDNSLIEENNADFKRLKSHYKNTVFGGGTFKQVCSIEAGKYVVHYYLTESDPTNLKTITFIKIGGKYYLSNGLGTNLRVFLTNGMVPKKILETWQSQKN